MSKPNDNPQQSNYAQIPNWILDEPQLRDTDRLVLMSLYRCAYGGKLDAHPSQKLIASRLGLKRDTVKESFQRLEDAKVIRPRGQRRPGKREHYDLPWERPHVELDDYAGRFGKRKVPTERAGQRAHQTGRFGRKPAQQTGTKKTIAEHKPENDGREAPLNKYITDFVPASPSLSFSEVQSAEGSAELPGSGLTESGSIGNGRGAKGDDDSALVGRCDSSGDTGSFADWAAEWDAQAAAAEAARPKPVPAKQMTKQLVNDALLTPEGWRASDSIDDLHCDAYTLITDVGGQWSPNTWRSLESLTKTHGVQYVAFWTKWLARKIADEYERGRPVEKPTALLLKAIEGKWEVNPRWPEFNEELHTWRAAEWLRQVEQQKNGEQQLTLADEELYAIAF